MLHQDSWDYKPSYNQNQLGLSDISKGYGKGSSGKGNSWDGYGNHSNNKWETWGTTASNKPSSFPPMPPHPAGKQGPYGFSRPDFDGKGGCGGKGGTDGFSKCKGGTDGASINDYGKGKTQFAGAKVIPAAGTPFSKPSTFQAGKGVAGLGCKGEAFAKVQPSSFPHQSGSQPLAGLRGRPVMVPAPRLPNYKGSDTARGAAPKTVSAAAPGVLTPPPFRGGPPLQAAPAGFTPPPSHAAPRPTQPVQVPPPPLTVPPPGLGAGIAPTRPMLALPMSGFTRPAAMAPELPALTAGGEDGAVAEKPPLGIQPAQDKKPRLFLLMTRLSPDLEDAHMQQILEQCGEVHAWRRGRDQNGAPLSFGFALFGDPEAAWKASTCLSKRLLRGQEIKVLVEEAADILIQQWRSSQQAALKLSNEEELEWELERKTVSCKALIDQRVEEIYGPQPGAPSVVGAAAQRTQELREREKARLRRMAKRKAWREAEFAKELNVIEAAEKRARKAECEKDAVDRQAEEAEGKEKEDQDFKLAKVEDGEAASRVANLAENRTLVEMVDKVQAAPRDELFKMELDVSYLRNEKVLEKKLRPWLEKKIDLCMGGPQSDLVEYILRRVNASSMPDALISDLSRYLDDNAEPLIERVWRMLAFEHLCNGLTSASSLFKKENKEEPS